MTTKEELTPTTSPEERGRTSRLLKFLHAAGQKLLDGLRYGHWLLWEGKRCVLSPRATAVVDSIAEWTIGITIAAKASLDAASAQWGGTPYVLYATWGAVALLGASKLARLVFRRRRPQLEDVQEIRHMQDKLDLFRDEAASAGSVEVLERLTASFVEETLASVCRAFGRPGSTRASIMLDQDGYLSVLRIHPKLPEDRTDPRFRIRVQGGKISARSISRDEKIGAAGYAYWGLDTVYVPSVLVRTGIWIVRRDGRLEPFKIHFPAWVKSGAARRYSCLASVPVYLTLGDEKYSRWGVLNIENKRADSMSDSDFYVACVLANLLAQAYSVTHANNQRLAPKG